MELGRHQSNKELVTLADQPGVALCGDRADGGGPPAVNMNRWLAAPLHPRACALGVSLSSSEPQCPHLKNGEVAMGLKSGTGGGHLLPHRPPLPCSLMERNLQPYYTDSSIFNLM